jgi:hypothetical protein
MQTAAFHVSHPTIRFSATLARRVLMVIMGLAFLGGLAYVGIKDLNHYGHGVAQK